MTTRRITMSNGQSLIVVEGMQCLHCGTVIECTSSFLPSEPIEGLCEKCQAAAMREDYGMVCNGHHDSPHNAPLFAAELHPGKSSGRQRKSMCYGNGENANGMWDNLVRDMEECGGDGGDK